MLYRLFTILLIIIILFFFVYHRQNKNNFAIKEAEHLTLQELVEDQFIKDEFLILLDKGDEKYLEQVLKQYDLKLIKPIANWLLVKRSAAGDREEAVSINDPSYKSHIDKAAMIERHHAVHSAHLNYSQNEFTLTLPKDPLYQHQWHLKKDGLNMKRAWNISKGSNKTVLAIVDRYFSINGDYTPCKSRQYFYDNILDYLVQSQIRNNPLNSHGSNVLSAVAPCTNNNQGLAGIDWHTQIFMVDSKYDASMSTRILAMLWAAGINIQGMPINTHKANVINASFGLTGKFKTSPSFGPMLDSIGRINQQKTIVVASAGNEGEFIDERLPGSAFGVISVGASTKEKKRALFSNYGHTVDILAPGENIIGLNKNKPIILNGTSFAAPIVSGIVTLMLNINPNLSYRQAEYILKKTATPMTCDSYCHDDNMCKRACCNNDVATCSSGIINPYQALMMTKNGIPLIPLVDLEDYYLPLSDDNLYQGQAVILNWGKKTANVSIKSDSILRITPNNISVPGLSDENHPGRAVVNIVYPKKPKERLIIKLILTVKDHSTDNQGLVAVIEIVPDHK